MKKIALTMLTMLACLAASACFAGQPYALAERHNPQPEFVFADTEFSLDVFGFYQNAEPGNPYSDGFGGGIGANVFFARHFGFGVDAGWSDQSEDDTVIHAVSGSFIVRFPIDRARLAPYVLAGGGGRFDGDKVANLHAGGGIEFRATRNFGVFSEGRYVWNEEKVNDVAIFRTGLRFAF